jgi:hypothetical protein
MSLFICFRKKYAISADWWSKEVKSKIESESPTHEFARLCCLKNILSLATSLLLSAVLFYAQLWGSSERFLLHLCCDSFPGLGGETARCHLWWFMVFNYVILSAVLFQWLCCVHAYTVSSLLNQLIYWAKSECTCWTVFVCHYYC